ncbi:hypothetical protein B9J78_01415 [bacterium Unc6]|nr:hypothetical protein [bacterium Unc6]
MKTTENTEFTENNYPFSEITDKIIKCAIEVHRTLGNGFLESIYENAMIYELEHQGLKIEKQKIISVVYKGNIIGEHRLDLLVEGEIIVENKTVKEFDVIHQAQILSYLKAAKKRIGLLINFAKTKIDIKRVIL